MSSKRGGGSRRGRGRGRGTIALAEDDMGCCETSAPSSPSTTSDKEENVEFTSQQSPLPCLGSAAEHSSSTLLNPKINHRSDAIFGDQMYLPERVMRQFGLRQSIPPPFRPTLQALHRISRRGRERENWEETHREYIQEWEARRHRIFRESEQYDPSSYEEYLHWYSGATRRYLVPSISDDVEAGPSLQPDDSVDLQYQAKAPMIRKAVDKLHGMVKKAKIAMTSTSDTTTQALVFEFLHGFQDVLHDLGEIKENGVSANSPHVELAASQDMPLLLLEAEQNIVDADQEAEHQEEEELHMVDDATMTLEPMDEENNGFSNVICPCPSLELEEHCHSATPTIDECNIATSAPDSAIPEQSTDVDQDGHLENPNEMDQIALMVEPICVDNNGSINALSSSPSAQALEESCEVTEAANANVDSASQATGSSTPQQDMDVKLDAEQEKQVTTDDN
uniref:Aminotransferase-like plant mobile domain-containing protein n=1 Tax=Leersia perrieri TaxID=77586 RepID=A0A0D9WN46_9ORYZ